MQRCPLIRACPVTSTAQIRKRVSPLLSKTYPKIHCGRMHLSTAIRLVPQSILIHMVVLLKKEKTGYLESDTLPRSAKNCLRVTKIAHPVPPTVSQILDGNKEHTESPQRPR